MSKKVTYARLQTGAYVVGAGDLGVVFPPNSKTLSDLSMYALDNALSISFVYRGLRKDLLVPFGNVVLMELAPDLPALKKAING